MGYAEDLEHYSSMGFSGADARSFAGNGIRPNEDDFEEEDEETEEEDE